MRLDDHFHGCYFSPALKLPKPKKVEQTSYNWQIGGNSLQLVRYDKDFPLVFVDLEPVVSSLVKKLYFST